MAKNDNALNPKNILSRYLTSAKIVRIYAEMEVEDQKTGLRLVDLKEKLGNNIQNKTLQRQMKEYIPKLFENLEPKALKNKNWVIPGVDKETLSIIYERLLFLGLTIGELQIGGAEVSTKQFAERIQMENRKFRGSEHLESCFKGVFSQKVMKVTFKDYENRDEQILTVHPYGLREFKGRWYLIGNCTHVGHIYGEKIDTSVNPIIFNKNEMARIDLDRVFQIQITKENADYDAEWNEKYKPFFGIIYEPNKQAGRVVLRARNRKAQYIKSYKIHHSQKIISEGEENGFRYMDFEYYMVSDTHDFLMEILSHGDELKVLEPASLNQRIVSICQQMVKEYKDASE